MGAELGAKVFVLWGGREGTETDACRRPDEAVKRLREAMNYLVRIFASTRLRLSAFALEASPTSRGAKFTWRRPAAYLGLISDARLSRIRGRESGGRG